MFSSPSEEVHVGNMNLTLHITWQRNKGLLAMQLEILFVHLALGVEKGRF